MNRKQCCWSDPNQGIDGDNCLSWVSYGDSETVLGQFALFIMYCLFGTLFAAIAVVFVKCLAPYACGSGIPEVKTILSGFVMHGYLGLGTLIVKTLTMPLAVAAGLMLGKEGPLVHVACCCGRFISRFFPKVITWSTRVALTRSHFVGHSNETGNSNKTQYLPRHEQALWYCSKREIQLFEM